VQFCLRAGSGLYLSGAVLCWLAHKHSPSLGQDDYFSLMILSIIVLWISGFIFCTAHGLTRPRVSRCVPSPDGPDPDFLIEELNLFLQARSTATAYGLLRLMGVTVFRQGFVPLLTGIDIEVAKQCSGIRSSLALLITTLVVGSLLSARFGGRPCWSYPPCPFLL